MRVNELLKIKGGPLITIGPNETVLAAIQKLVENNIGAFPVCNAKGNILGIVSERDLLTECSQHSNAIDRTKVKDVMTKDVVVGIAGDDVDHVASTMIQKGIRHLPIMVGPELEGVISMRDIVEAQLEQSKAELRALSDYMLGGDS